MPAYFRSAADATRSDDDEKLKKRRTKRCDSASSSLAFGPVSCCWTKLLRGWPSRSAIDMLRESSTSTPRKFCCGTAALRISAGRNRQKSRTASAASRRPTSTTRSRSALGRRHAAIGEQREHGERRRRRDRQQHRARQAPGEIALLEDERRILEQEAKELVHHQALILIQARSEWRWRGRGRGRSMASGAQRVQRADLTAQAGADGRRPGRRVARRERFGRFVVDAIVAAPAGALEQLAGPVARVRQAAFAGQRPPREAAADAGEDRPGRSSAAADPGPPARRRRCRRASVSSRAVRACRPSRGVPTRFRWLDGLSDSVLACQSCP